jgi:imidazoleglycerol-phosphate dehydratase
MLYVEDIEKETLIMGSRTATVARNTKETKITVSLNIDGTGKSEINTGIGFFDHMLEGFAKHGLFDLEVNVEGDLNVDGHHTVEDTGIVLGQAIVQAIGDKKGIKRYGNMILPMDESLVLSAIDLCGRPYFVMDAEFSSPMVGDFDTQLVREFFYAVSYSAMMNIHLRVITGINDHHKIEAMFKAFAKSLDEATTIDPRITDVLSTKGAL